MKTRSQRKYLDQLLPELVRAVLSCLRPADALPLARCSKHCATRMSVGLVVVGSGTSRTLGLGDRGISPGSRAAWAISARVGAANRTGQARLGLTLGEGFSTYSPRATLRTVGEAPFTNFLPRPPHRTLWEDEDD